MGSCPGVGSLGSLGTLRRYDVKCRLLFRAAVRVRSFRAPMDLRCLACRWGTTDVSRCPISETPLDVLQNLGDAFRGREG